MLESVCSLSLRELQKCFTNFQIEQFIPNNAQNERSKSDGTSCEKHTECTPDELPLRKEDIQILFEESNSFHFVQTLPTNVYCKKSGINDAEYGIWSNVEIPKGVRFGPYKGVIISYESKEQNDDFSQDLADNSSSDVKSENKPNWLSFINFATRKEQQNLTVLHCDDGCVYYETSRDVPSDTELLIWYEDNWIEEEWDVDNSSCDGTLTKDKYCKSRTGLEVEPNYNISLSAFWIQENFNKMKMNNIDEEPSTNAKYIEFDRSIERNESCETSSNDLYFVCAFCKKSFMTYNELKQHKTVHLGEKNYICNLCGKKYSEKDHLKRHVNTHSGIKPYVCDTCGSRFTQKGTLNRHLLLHTGEKSSMCSFCNKMFRNQYKLIEHRFVHMGEKPYVCTVCSSRFVDTFQLKEHKHIHLKEKSYVCNLCDKRFRRNQQLKQHSYFHTGQRPRPYLCDFCGHKFTEKCVLDRHKTIHTGEKPYTCNLCGKQFPRYSELNQHRRVHTGEKPYICDLCGLGYSRSRSLKSHMLKHSVNNLSCL